MSNAYKTFIETNDGMVIFLADKKIHLQRVNPLFDEVKALIDGNLVAQIPDLVDMAGKIRKYGNGHFFVNEFGVIVLDGEAIPENLSVRLLDFVDNNIPTDSLELFWGLLKANESEDSRQDLWGFLAHNDIPLTKDGMFLAYKRVATIEEAIERGHHEDMETAMVLVNVDGVMTEVPAQPGDLVDARTGTIRNNPGDKPFLDRNEVDADRDRTCSYGLHVAARGYAEHRYYSNGALLEVIIDPRDVVAVPRDYSGEKMRCTTYLVNRIAGEPRTEPLAFTENAEVVYTCPDSAETEKVTIIKAHDGHPNRYDVRFNADDTVLNGVAEEDLSWPKSWDDDADYDEEDGVTTGTLDDTPEDPTREGLRKLRDDAQALLDGLDADPEDDDEDDEDDDYDY
jgi:hypothetical protein